MFNVSGELEHIDNTMACEINPLQVAHCRQVQLSGEKYISACILPYIQTANVATCYILVYVCEQSEN